VTSFDKKKLDSPLNAAAFNFGLPKEVPKPPFGITPTPQTQILSMSGQTPLPGSTQPMSGNSGNAGFPPVYQPQPPVVSGTPALPIQPFTFTNPQFSLQPVFQPQNTGFQFELNAPDNSNIPAPLQSSHVFTFAGASNTPTANRPPKKYTTRKKRNL
jgi:hypothetical protein